MEREEVIEPMTPSDQFLSTSIFTVSVIAVMESEISLSLDETQVCQFVRDSFLPLNPRFSSIMVLDDKGKKYWKNVEVNIKGQIKFPTFSATNSIKLYDESFNEYLTKTSMEKFPENKPLWELHIIKYPTTEAAGFIIFKFHHSLGDGISLMATLLSCFRRADNPSLPLTLPSVQIHRKTERNNNNMNIFKIVPKVVSSIYYTLSDFCSSIGFSCGFFQDDISPIRSGHRGVEHLPTTTVTMSFSLDSIKQIKNKLGVTINDVLSGIIHLGTRLYMEAEREGSGTAKATSMVILDTRMVRGYKPIQEMLKPNSDVPWGNKAMFMPTTIPKLNSAPKDPLQFVWKARKIIQRKRSSFGTFLTAKFFKLEGKVRSPEVMAKYFHEALKNTSLVISNMIGPIEQMAFVNHPIRGLYFLIAGVPQSLVTGVVSYNGKLRICALMEKDFMDPYKFKLCVENAFNLISEAACKY